MFTRAAIWMRLDPRYIAVFLWSALIVCNMRKDKVPSNLNVFDEQSKSVYSTKTPLIFFLIVFIRMTSFESPLMTMTSKGKPT